MKIVSAELNTVLGVTSKIPESTLPEFAFFGKSNVGKSSLINAVLGRKSLARTSQEPGKTQTLNFYLVNDAFFLVDLPGYGYAKTSAATREKWMKMIEKYLQTSTTLQHVFLLIDIRHLPSRTDIDTLHWLYEKQLRPVVLLTKSDKLSKNEQFKMLNQIKKALDVPEDVRIIPVSSEKKSGIEEIHGVLAETFDF